MASTWSALKIELLETGQNSGTWGTLTNVNLGDAVLGEAITGQATVDFASDADVTITLTDSATTQAARNLRLNITESSTGIGSVRNLILGSGCQIEKFYLINNTGTGAKTVKNTSGTGISVPAGKATLVYNNGTNVVDAASYFSSLTLGSALPVASGGTGITSFGTGVATALGVNTGSAGAFVVNGGALGSPSSAGTIPAFTLGGTIAGGGNQINNVIIGTSTPLAGAFTSVTASTTLGVTGVSTLTGGAVVQGLTVGLGAGAVSGNTALGASALATNSTGANLVAVGYQALNLNTASNNTAVGYQAGTANTTGTQNTFVGRIAGATNSAGSYNSAFGDACLNANNTGSNNTSVGYGALQLNITASNSTAVGSQALYTNTESANTAVGYQAGYNNAGGDYLTVVGYQAGKGNTSGRFNTAVGRDALLTNSTSNDNTAVGTNALKLATVGGNTAVGSNALGVNSTGASNIGVGNGALTRNTTGSNNVGVGVDTLSFNVAASENTSVGYQAGYSIASGAGNVCVGMSAGLNITSSYNTAVGRYAMGGTGDKSGGGFNVAVGNGSGEELTTGEKNTFVGWASGYKITTGSKNTIIGGYSGNQGGLDIRTASNYIVLSDGDGNPRGVFDGSGNLGIGTTSPSYRLDVFQSGSVNVLQVQGNATDGSVLARYHQAANSGDNGFIAFLTETAPTGRGSITYNRAGGLVAYNTTSDYRAKDISGPVTGSGALIDSTPVYMGKMKDATQERPMFIAHEVPAYAHTGEKDAVDKDGKPVYQQMDASALIPVMWAELQSLRARVAQLESKP